MPAIASLECSRCHAHVSAETPQTVCPACAGALYVRYDMDELRRTAARPDPPKADRAPSAGMWRYASVLPDVEPVSLGEGWTPMLRSRQYPNLYLKEEAGNPTGSFKARGMSMAVSMARHYGLEEARRPLRRQRCRRARRLRRRCRNRGAHLHAARRAHRQLPRSASPTAPTSRWSTGSSPTAPASSPERSKSEGWFDVSTLKEPFRIEGKKTMGYELVEQLGWEYPDAVFYPTGGGVGLIGMWKAFEEMEALGWVKPGKRPRMFALQASGCAPIAAAFSEGKAVSEFFANADTFAAGLRVPKPYGDSIILEILQQSGGMAVESSDEKILSSLLKYAKTMLFCSLRRVRQPPPPMTK